MARPGFLLAAVAVSLSAMRISCVRRDDSMLVEDLTASGQEQEAAKNAGQSSQHDESNRSYRDDQAVSGYELVEDGEGVTCAGTISLGDQVSIYACSRAVAENRACSQVFVVDAKYKRSILHITGTAEDKLEPSFGSQCSCSCVPVGEVCERNTKPGISVYKLNKLAGEHDSRCEKKVDCDAEVKLGCDNEDWNGIDSDACLTRKWGASHDTCEAYANGGYCPKHREVMHACCPKACSSYYQACADNDACLTSRWGAGHTCMADANVGYCSTHGEIMHFCCPKACSSPYYKAACVGNLDDDTCLTLTNGWGEGHTCVADAAAGYCATHGQVMGQCCPIACNPPVVYVQATGTCKKETGAECGGADGKTCTAKDKCEHGVCTPRLN